MSQAVTDTHALYWHLSGDPRLSANAQQFFAQADVGMRRVLVPSIVLVEMIYLAERNRLDIRQVERVFALLDTVGGSYSLVPLDRGTVEALRVVPGSAIPDMPDRIIVATAHQLGLPLITKDGKITSSHIVPIIW